MPQARDEAGNIWEVDAQGNPIALVQAASEPSGPPVDPGFQYEGPQAAAQAQSAQANATVDSATIKSQIALANAQAAKAQADANAAIAAQNAPDASRPDITSASFSEAMQGFTASMALSDTIAALEQRYREGPGSTEGVFGALDYLPLAQNERFDRASNAARGTVGDVLGFTGGQLNSAQEAQMNVGPYIPTAADKDSVIEDSIERLRKLQQQGIERSVGILGGVPDASGNIMPIPQGQIPTIDNIDEIRKDAAPNPADDGGPNAWDTITLQGQGERQAAGAGAEETTVEYPDGYERDLTDALSRLMSENGGRIPPDEHARIRSEIDREYGFKPRPDAYKEWAEGQNEYLDAGGRTVPPLEPRTKTLSKTETLRNDLVSNPVGAAATGYANAATLGTVNALASNQSEALADAYPLSSLGGEIAGSVTGAGAVGALGRNTVGRAAPKLLGGGGRSQLGRNLATDVTYAGGYSANSGDDVATGSALGAGGSLLGQAVGRGAGAVVGGIQRSAPAQALVDRGVRLSVGRSLGDTFSRVEDLLASVPFVGGQVRGRQKDAFQDFSRAGLEKVGDPIGFKPQRIGAEGLDDLNQAVSGSYDQALNGAVSPLDTEFFRELRPLRKDIDALPGDYGTAANNVFQGRVEPALANRSVTPDQFQQALRGLRSARSKAGQVGHEGFENEYRDVLGNMEDMLTGVVERTNGPQVSQGLKTANTAYRNARILEDASLNRAKIGTQTGEVDVYTPAQLKAAARASEKKYGAQSPLTQLANEGQAVLPSTVPNSGTADRMMASTALGAVGLGGLGLGETATTGDASTTMQLGGLAGALALLGTRKGQAGLNKALFERGDTAQQIGNYLRRRTGLFGSTGGGSALQGQ